MGFGKLSKRKDNFGCKKGRRSWPWFPCVNEHLAFRTILLDAASTLYSVAATTDKIRSGNSILDIVTRTPVIFAKTLSSIDIPSSWRLFDGVGTGFYKGDHVICGIPFEEKDGKGLAEELDILVTLWNQSNNK